MYTFFSVSPLGFLFFSVPPPLALPFHCGQNHPNGAPPVLFSHFNSRHAPLPPCPAIPCLRSRKSVQFPLPVHRCPFSCHPPSTGPSTVLRRDSFSVLGSPLFQTISLAALLFYYFWTWSSSPPFKSIASALWYLVHTATTSQPSSTPFPRKPSSFFLPVSSSFSPFLKPRFFC